MRYSLVIVAVLGALYWPAPSVAGWFGPSDYDECILESMKGVTSDQAARLIARSCREKFPIANHQDVRSRALSEDETKRLTRTGSWSNFAPYKWVVEVHNGNGDVTLTEMWIEIVGTIDGKQSENIYRANATIQPYNRGTFWFDIIIPEEEWSWQVVEVRGY